MVLAVSSGTAWAKPRDPGDFTSKEKLHALKKRVRAEIVPIIDSSRISGTLEKLKKGTAPVRILHLGDSHVASDYITGIARHRLQEMYGDAGRGFSHIDQAWGYGGRRLKRTDRDWVRDRIVDRNRAGRPFGFSGISIESKRKNAKAVYRVEPEDRTVRVYYQAQPGGAPVDVLLDGKKIGAFETDGDRVSKIFAAELGAGGRRKLTLVARGKKARLYGISFETGNPGVLYDSIGPVGADAKVYLQLDPASFSEHLIAHAPDLVVLMVGGNDALKIRKGWTTLEKVTSDHENLLRFLREKLPEADCMLWTPMDAGEKTKRGVVSKRYLGEVRQMQLEVAKRHGCAVWDMYRSMGGAESIGRWVKARVMNRDLVHPKRRAADLLGSLFVDAWKELADGSGGP